MAYSGSLSVLKYSETTHHKNSSGFEQDMEGIFIVPFAISKLKTKFSIILQINHIFKLDIMLPMGNQGLVQKDIPETTSDMQIDPAAAELRQTPCAICILDVKEVHQPRNLAANLHTFSIYLHVFLFSDCWFVRYMLLSTHLDKW